MTVHLYPPLFRQRRLADIRGFWESEDLFKVTCYENKIQLERMKRDKIGLFCRSLILQRTKRFFVHSSQKEELWVVKREPSLQRRLSAEDLIASFNNSVSCSCVGNKECVIMVHKSFSSIF